MNFKVNRPSTPLSAADAVASGWLTEAERADVQARVALEGNDMGMLASTAYVEIIAIRPE